MSNVSGAATDGQPRRSRRAKRLAAATFSILLAFAIAEGVVRAFIPQSDFFSHSDDTTGVAGVPNLKGRMCSPEFMTHVSTNSYGFRDREPTLEKAPGGKRVVVLGDSFTEALQVEFAETYHTLLEEKLKASLGPSFDLVAMGLPGVGTAQEMLLYEHLGWKFAPDVVLVLWLSGNDLQDNNPKVKYYYPGFQLGPGPEELIPVTWKKQVGSDGLLGEIVRTNHCQLLSLVARAYRTHWLLTEIKNRESTPIPPPPSPALPPTPPPPPAPSPTAAPDVKSWPDAEAWEITRRIFDRLNKDTASHGAKLVVAMIPPVDDLDQHVTGGHVATLCRSLGIPSVDLAPALRAERAAHPDARLYFPVDRHFTPRGHAAIVPSLVQALEPLLK